MIHCSNSRKTEFLCQLEAEVIYYCEDHDQVNLATLSNYFGNPEDVARDFLSELGESALIKSNSIKFRLRSITIAIIIVATFLILGLKIFISYKQQQVLDGYYVESITYEGELSPGATSPTYIVDYYHSEDDIPNTK